MPREMQEKSDVPLTTMTSLKLGGVAKRVIFAESEDEIALIVREADAAKTPLLVLGGGSNLVVGDDGFAGLVMRVASRGVRIEGDGEHVRLDVDAGEPWDELVARACDEGFTGIECLSGIPGLVGATPMQNVGAYGQDVSAVIEHVRAFDRERNEIVVVENAECAFAYRHSRFRGSSRFVITRVRFRMKRGRTAEDIRYAELSRALGGEAPAPLARIRETVIALRRKKGMVLDASDADSVSAGSFFTNPIVDDARVPAVAERANLTAGESMPHWPEAPGKTKLSAGWLIERAGFTKGTTRGRAAISTKHALALVNRGGTTTELVALAAEIRDGVFARLGVELSPEPIFIGASLPPLKE
jgi:UDP-N-acetylmuramate dehydrogenase